MLIPPRFRLAALALCSLLWIAGAPAQTAKKGAATIQGIVLDANGKPVSAAAVTCQSSAGIHPRVVHTDAKGHFVVTGLKQDSYDLRATSKGAYSDWEKNIPLRSSQNKQVTLRLLNGNTALSGVLPAKGKNE
ncbi:MAG TPA: carboxypeptidase-like regulatory domain-containing protein [Candidatus Saccharimonadales bacterium]|nr:carboxypeptidase-like regulatory domain-containing protein [Candidatus Saccharimonadales bacterium]